LALRLKDASIVFQLIMPPKIKSMAVLQTTLFNDIHAQLSNKAVVAVVIALALAAK
jgi:hypothetical protein